MNKSDKKLIILQEVESTNNYANELIGLRAEEGTVVLAHYQQKGRGQLGNYWESEAGKNLLISIILYPDFLAAEAQFMISKVVCLGIFDFLRQETGSVTIKWPNDLYIGNRKICGVLIENSILGRNLSSSVLGIGLNLNQNKFVSGAPNPVSLGQITGKKYEIEKVAEEITGNIFTWYKKLREGKLEEINTAYHENLFRKGFWSSFIKNKITFEARIAGIDEIGRLLLENRDGEITGYMFKEVEFVL